MQALSVRYHQGKLRDPIGKLMPMLPGKMGMASGLILGFTFASGALGTLLSGMQADIMGFNAVFYTTAGIALVAGLLALPLDKITRLVE